MMRRCHIGRCTTRPLWFVAPSPAVAGVAGAAGCGTHLSRVLREVMAEHSTQWVRVRSMDGAEVATDNGSVWSDRLIGGEPGNG